MRSALYGLSFCIAAAPAWAEVPAQTTAAAPTVATAAPVPTASTTVSAAAAQAATVAPPIRVTAATYAVSALAVVKAPSCEEIKVFKAKMHAAVDAALRYPAELKFRPAAGVTIVTYDYQDGRALDPHITQWSGDGRLDRAALNAVKNADFASITPGIGHQHIRDAVIIVFDNSANIDKNAREQPKKKDPAAEQCGG